MAPLYDSSFANAEIFSLKQFSRPVADVNSDNSDKDARRSVKRQRNQVSRFEKLQTFVCKRGKSGETSAKSDGQK